MKTRGFVLFAVLTSFLFVNAALSADDQAGKTDQPAVQTQDSGTAKSAETTNAGSSETKGTPKIFVQETVHEFAQVVEGTEVTYDYIVQNKGDAQLDIVNVKTG